MTSDSSADDGASLDFWYEFASTYSYLTAMRIDALAEEAGVAVRWRPFLLGPIFAAQGWTTSPFNLFPAKGRNMWRDMERQCDRFGLPLTHPDPFPQNALQAARIALIGEPDGWTPAFTRAVYHAHFGLGLDLTDQAMLSDALSGAGQDPGAVFERIAEPDAKQALKDQVAEAHSIGIFGAPSFVTRDGELFWGNDRLDQALDWARSATE